MREIKFRGKTENGKWVYGSYVATKSIISGKDIYRIIPFEMKTYANDERFADGSYEVQPETVGQFTGLFDKNGKEIYEGDIVEFDAKEWGSDKTNKHLVSWNGENAEFDFGGGFNYENKFRTIIGNVYENSEFLK